MVTTCDDGRPAGAGVSSNLTASSTDGPRRRSRSTGSADGAVRLARSAPPVRSQAPSGASGHRLVPDTISDRFGPAVDRGLRRLRHTAPRVIGLVAIGGIIAALALPSVLESRPATGSLSRGVGTVDFSYQAQGVKAPTGRKPEAAKLWFNDGSWWGVLFDRSRDAYMIYRFDWDSDSWVGTGQMVDDRNFSRADVLWDGSHLYTVSGGIDPASAKHRALALAVQLRRRTPRVAPRPRLPVRHHRRRRRDLRRRQVTGRPAVGHISRGASRSS